MTRKAQESITVVYHSARRGSKLDNTNSILFFQTATRCSHLVACDDKEGPLREALEAGADPNFVE